MGDLRDLGDLGDLEYLGGVEVLGISCGPGSQGGPCLKDLDWEQTCGPGSLGAWEICEIWEVGGDLGYLGGLRGLEVLGISCGPRSQGDPGSLGGSCLEGDWKQTLWSWNSG